MEGLKRSKQALGAEVISRFNDFAPPTLLAQASRINFSTRLFNLIVTNVPGPQMPLYVLGRELEEVFPVAFLPQNHALAVAIMSYNGTRRLRPARRLRLDGGRRSDRRRASTSRWPSSRRPPAAAAARLSARGRRARLSRLCRWLFLVVLFIVVPIVELYVIIQVGAADRRLADPGAAARRRAARLAAAAPPGPRRLAALQRGARRAALPRPRGRRRPADRDRRHPAAHPRLHHRHLRPLLPDPADPGDRPPPAQRRRRQAVRRHGRPGGSRLRGGERRQPRLRVRQTRRAGGDGADPASNGARRDYDFEGSAEEIEGDDPQLPR